jgi:hypothetical protein
MPTRPSATPARRLFALALVAALGVGACASGSSGASTGRTAAPSTVPASTEAGGSAASPVDADTIAHPTGAGDIVLRAATRGGFVRLETVMSRLPEFTLYGDGRALVLPPGDEPSGGGGGLNPGAAGNGPVTVPTMREVRLSEDEVQALLKFALVDGRLGTARDAYMGGNMDAPSTVFELHADGTDRSILVTGLTDDPAPGPDAAALRAFSALVDRLRSIGTDADYASDRVMAEIAETSAVPGAVVQAWPLTDLAPADFPQPPDDAASQFPARLLTAAQATAAEAMTGGGPGIVSVKGPDGRVYALLLRPALPEELAAG